MWKTRPELEHQVVTLAGQGLARRAIARAMGVSRNTVRKILEAHVESRQAPQAALTPAPARVPRAQKLDDFRDKVTDLLTRFPDITAQRIFEELRVAGYDGGYTQIKVHVGRVRPLPPPTPSLSTPIYGTRCTDPVLLKLSGARHPGCHGDSNRMGSADRGMAGERPEVRRLLRREGIFCRTSSALGVAAWQDTSASG